MPKYLYLCLVFACFNTYADDHDVVRERMGLKRVESQLSRLLELSHNNKLYANPNAKAPFDYEQFERRVEVLRRDVEAHINHPLTPRRSPSYSYQGEQ